MIYLSSNGEVIGQFEESAVPQMRKRGEIGDDAFYWREGMPEWLPVTKLAEAPEAKSETKPILPKLVRAPVAATPAAAAVAAAGPVLTPAPQAAPGKTFIPRRSLVAGPAAAGKLIKPEKPPIDEPQTAVIAPRLEAGKDGMDQPPAEVSKPARAPVGAFAAKRGPVAAKPETAKAQLPVAASAPGAGKGGGRKSWLMWLLVLLLLAAGAGGSAWWWLNRVPAPIPGRVSLSGDESGPVEIRIFRREELAGPWRERLAAADARANELDKLIAEAQAAHREKSILYDEAAGVCAAGEEYNMPDVEELRADRDAKKADADVVKAELDKLQTEKGGLLNFEGLLAAVPAPLQTILADQGGNFLLPRPETGDVVLLATASSQADGQSVSRGWLEIVEVAEDGSAPGEVQFSETNRLDIDAIRQFAGATP